MKRILLTSLALAALASCTKTEIAYAPADEIQILPVNANVTKSVMDGNEFKGSEFMVWAWFNQTPAGEENVISTWQSDVADGSTTLYIDEKPFIEKEIANRTNVWGGSVPYFWPKAGSLIFAGYHAPNLTAEDAVTYTFEAGKNYMEFKGVQQAMVAAPDTNEDGTTTQTWAEDIMYFNMTPASYNATSGVVNVDFKHALTWLSVTLEKKTNPEIQAEITIHDVIFTNVCTTGNGKVENQSPIVWTEDTNTKASLEVLKNGNKVLKYDKTGEKIESVVIPLDDYLIIPQQIYGTLQVRYSVKSSDNSTFTETYTLDLKTDLKEGNRDEWLPGKHYIYKIAIGTDELLVTPEITDWADDPTSVLIPMPETTPGQPGADNNQDNII